MPSEGHIHAVNDQGIWSEVVLRERSLRPGPALFLDRDGVIVEELGYLRRPEDVRIVPGIVEVIGIANRAGVAVVVVSNQSGVGRGLFGWSDFAAVQRRILRDLENRGAFIDAVLACPYHADARSPFRHPDHPARKPNAGMILAAARLLPLLLSDSWIIGDRASDLAAGRAAGLAGGMLLLSGLGPIELDSSQPLADANFRVFAGHSACAALTLIPLLSGSLRPDEPANRASPVQARP